MKPMRVKLHKSHQLVSPKQGRLLIADPFAQDVCFFRSVILVLKSSHDGHMGLVLNKPLKKCLNHMFSKYGLQDMPIYCGGPVEEDRLFYLHNVPHIQGAVKIGDGYYVGGDLMELSQSLKSIADTYYVKFFMGYSGWSSGQLESEIKAESWVVSDVIVDVLASVTYAVWKDSLLALDDKYYSMWLNFPFDPESN